MFTQGHGGAIGLGSLMSFERHLAYGVSPLQREGAVSREEEGRQITSGQVTQVAISSYKLSVPDDFLLMLELS